MSRLSATAAVTALAACLSCTGKAPAPAPSPTTAAAAASALSVEPAAFDFGRVLPGRSVQKEFRLRNLGRDALPIDSVTTDCGCMVVGEYARVLAPGASTALTVMLQTPPQPGALVRTLVVRTGGTSPGSLELRVRATVVGEEPPAGGV